MFFFFGGGGGGGGGGEGSEFQRPASLLYFLFLRCVLQELYSHLKFGTGLTAVDAIAAF